MDNIYQVHKMSIKDFYICKCVDTLIVEYEVTLFDEPL